MVLPAFDFMDTIPFPGAAPLVTTHTHTHMSRRTIAARRSCRHRPWSASLSWPAFAGLSLPTCGGLGGGAGGWGGLSVDQLRRSVAS